VHQENMAALPLLKTRAKPPNKIKFNPLKLCRMHWIHLTDEEQLKNIITKSQTKPQVIFKHSTRCSISAVALSRLQKAQQPADLDFYFLDLITYRKISNKIAEIFKVHHESPQILLIRNGECTYDESHLAISMDEILDQAHAA
jgi:bacillithiol system protein YtxJ